MKMLPSVIVESAHAVAHVTLNRPDRRNAYDGRLVSALHTAFEEIGRDDSIRVVVLTGAGTTFCAGADLRWMVPSSPVSDIQARADAEQLSDMYRAIDECPFPVIGRVNGAAFGGGVGLIAVCDIVVAAEHATFALSETKWGLVPAVISPFLLRKAGESFLRRYCLTGETFSAAVARQFHLIHEVVGEDALDKRIAELIDAVLYVAPGAAKDTKALLRRLLSLAEPDRRPVSVEANVQARLSMEASEGLKAFLEKRPPAWVPQKHTQTIEPLRPHDAADRRA